MNVKGKSYKEGIICHASPTSGQRTLGKWRSMKSLATTHFSSVERPPTLSPNIALALGIIMILAVILG